MKNIYDRYILPHLINCTCGSAQVCFHRQKIIPLATGRVLEVGMGSGLNLPYYRADEVEFIWGLEPSTGMRKKAQVNIDKSAIKVNWIDLPGEEIPLESHSVDTIVLTYTLCSISNWQLALEQMRRVLKPQGKLLFSEHGLAPEQNVEKWQHRLNPIWQKFSGGCHLNRPIDSYLQQSGFAITQLDKSYLRSVPKFVGFNFRGIATTR